MNHAETFLTGNTKELGLLIAETCDAMKVGIESIQFSEADQECSHGQSRAGSKAIIDRCIKAIQLIGKNMEKCEEQEPRDYHWLLIAEMILIIDALLIKLGG